MSRASWNACLAGVLASALLAGCVEQPAHREAGEKAELRSWMKILDIDGSAPDDPYRLILAPGQHRMNVLYETYQHAYLCHFVFHAQGGYSYEVVDHSNREPLVMYRWTRANGAWAERSEPLMPRCERTPRT